MAKFGRKSKERLATCDERLQKVFNEVINFSKQVKKNIIII